MLNRVKGWLRARARRFLGMDSLQGQVDQLESVKSRVDTIEPIVYMLEESYYCSRGELRPRRDKIFVGGADDFAAIGERFLGHFRDICGLRPDERVLDVGCGIGRMAVPLTKYLNEKGSYEGFDIVRDGIDWCNNNITSRYPNFHFQLADIFNKVYNPTGTFQAKEYRFPYADESFDFVFLISVFTHMLPEDMENYLRETARVLKNGGRCLITFFLWNQEVSRLVEAGKSKFDFRHEYGNYRVQDANLPESAVSYDEAFILSLYQKYGLTVKLPIHYGAWCGRDKFLDGQEILVASKG